MPRAHDLPPTLAPFVVLSVALGGFAMALFQPVQATCTTSPPPDLGQGLAGDVLAFDDPARASEATRLPEEVAADAVSGCSLAITVEGAAARHTTLSLALMGSEGTLHTISAVPGEGGHHRFTDLVEGTYHLTAHAPGLPLASPAPFYCRGDGERGFTEIRYADTSVRLSGRILGYHHRTPDKAELLVQQPIGHRDGLAGIAHVPVRADGTFEVLLTPGRHTLLATAPFHAPLTQQLTLAETSATILRLEHQPTVSGRVVDDRGVPVAGADVFVAAGLDPKARPLRVITDGKGAFSVPAHSSARVRLTARSATHLGSRTLPKITSLDGVRGVQIAIRPGRTVSGFVQTRSGRIKPHAEVRFRVKRQGLEGVVEADAEGRFEISGLPADDVELWAKGSAVGAWGGAVATRDNPRVLLTWVPQAYQRR